MKSLLKILILLFFWNVQSQNHINCDNVKKGIVDEKLYQKLENGKVIFKINLNENKVFLIRNSLNNKFYYVTKNVMRKIKKCNCENIVIEKIPKKGDINAPKIIRD